MSYSGILQLVRVPPVNTRYLSPIKNTGLLVVAWGRLTAVCVYQSKPNIHGAVSLSCDWYSWLLVALFEEEEKSMWTVIYLSSYCHRMNVQISDDNCRHLMRRLPLPNSKPSAYVKSAAGPGSGGGVMCQTRSWGIRGKRCGLPSRLGGHRRAAKTRTRLVAWFNTTVAPSSAEQREPEWHRCSCAVAARWWSHAVFCSRIESDCQSVGNHRSTFKNI